jgi:hypothetical protein
MKTLRIAFSILFIAFLVVGNMNSCSNVSRGARVNQGTIMTIDPTLQKVYVKILMGMRPYIIMGKVNSDTIFLKDDHGAKLSDFSEGERIIVQWRDKNNREVVELIEAYR